jgi:chromosome segregation ATPase
LPDKIQNDKDMVRKKEHDIDKRERKKDVESVLSNGRLDSDYTDKQRLGKLERKATDLNEFFDDLQNEGLTLARRVRELSTQLFDEEKKFDEYKRKNDKFEEKFDKFQSDEKDFDVRKEHKKDTKRELYLRVIGYAIPLTALIVAILIAIKVIK